ncbi:MAG TPA: hypothetical protein VL202_22300, partial [Pararhizobium sp.]|uniref:hypothetical protein n=1 Tax=Pararhizobium sp. TaxID=1977563 RepID=UPI002C09CE72
IRFRSFADDSDAQGQSVLRAIKTVMGENRAISLAGEGEAPQVGDLIHFGPVASESIPVIVASVERGNDNTSIVHMLPAADEMHERTAAEVPPTWSGRVGAEVGGSNAEPPVPIVKSVRSGISGTGSATGLRITLKPGAGSAVIVSTFEVRHRLSGSGTWLTAVTVSASSGVVNLPGYASGDAVEWEPRSVSKDSVPSLWGSPRITTIGADDPTAPNALNSSLIVATGGLGKADIFFTVAPTEENITHVQFYSNTSGTLDTGTDAILAPIDVAAGGTYTRVHGDPSIVTLVTNGNFSAQASPPTLGSNWTITSGHADHSPGTGGSISWSVAMAAGEEICLSVMINSISGGALTPRSTGTLTETWTTAYTTPGLKLQSHVAGSANGTLGLLAATATVCQIDDLAAYKKTAACLSQGDRYYWLQPFNGVTPGPIAGPFLVTIR